MKPTLESSVPAERVLVLRTVAPSGMAYGGFVHPLTVGKRVEAPDWNTHKKCGGGIHGALWGEGDGSLFCWGEGTLWQVYSVNPAEGLIDLDGKVKFRTGTLVFIGDRLGATEYVAQNGGAGRKIIGGTATAGYGGTATAGDEGTATAGNGGCISILWYDRSQGRYRRLSAEIGENGIKPNTKYRVNYLGKFEEIR